MAEDETVEGVERAVFGAVPTAQVDAWLRRHVRSRLGIELAEVVFRSGRVSAVYGLRLADGSSVVAKVHRGRLDAGRTASLAASVRAQRLLAAAGHPCPVPLDGPAVTEGLTGTLESLLDAGEPGDAHRPATRTAIATSLAEQVDLLRSMPEPARAALRDPPAWARYHHGPWPTPHDPIFDFTTTSPEHAWVDEVAAAASRLLTRSEARTGERVSGHSDWSCGNLRFAARPARSISTGPAGTGRVEVVAAWDWDSLVSDVEPVLAGMAAASFTGSSTSGAQAPTPAEAAGFLTDYDASRARPFTAVEQVTTAAALTWTLAYNARCEVDVLAMGASLPEGPVLPALAAGPDGYLGLRW